MGVPAGRGNRPILVLGLAALAVTVAFAVAVLIVPGDPLALHESAGAILLVLLGAAVALGARESSRPRSLLRWALLALLALIVAGATGALLAAGVLSPRFSALPLIPLTALGVLLLGLVTRARGRPGPGVPPPAVGP